MKCRRCGIRWKPAARRLKGERGAATEVVSGRVSSHNVSVRLWYPIRRRILQSVRIPSHLFFSFQMFVMGMTCFTCKAWSVLRFSQGQGEVLLEIEMAWECTISLFSTHCKPPMIYHLRQAPSPQKVKQTPWKMPEISGTCLETCSSTLRVGIYGCGISYIDISYIFIYIYMIYVYLRI